MTKIDSFCAVTRQMVEDMKADIAEIKSGQKDLNVKITELFNHQSSRWPPAAAWSVAAIGTVLGAVITYGVTKFLGL